jgi:sterol desaturase/sphingolipid hydroxylase (fatty acid hydroxylase superfamily)
VEVGERPFSVLPLGLDMLILSLLFSALIFIPIEKLFPKEREQVILRAEWQDDLAYFALINLLVSVVMAVVTASGPLLFGWAAIPSLQRAVASQPAWLQFLEMLFIADLAQYVSHRWYHENRALWRIHAVHHSVRTMDWLAGSRLHLAEVLATRCAVFLPLYVLGFSQSVLYTYIAFVSFHAVFIHANVGIDFGWLRYVVATPQYHHWHHSDDPKVMNKNFAVHLPVLDLLFGTYYQPPGEWPASYGVIGKPLPRGLMQQFLYPFRAWRGR